MQKMFPRRFIIIYITSNPRFVRSVQVVEINHEVLRKLPHVFLFLARMCMTHNEHKPCLCVS